MGWGSGAGVLGPERWKGQHEDNGEPGSMTLVTPRGALPAHHWLAPTRQRQQQQH